MGMDSGTLDAQGDLATEGKQDAIIENQTDKSQFTKITNGVNDLTINSEGRADVVQHAHPNNGYIHFESGDLIASQDFILIDISDTTNYPHTNTGYIHFESLRLHTDASNNADYTIQIGFLENVDATDGDFYVFMDADGSQTTGRSQDIFLNYYPNGPRCRTESTVISDVSLNDTAFQTDVNLASTLDPTTLDTPSGSRDLVVRIIVTAGTVDVGIEGSYHSHA